MTVTCLAFSGVIAEDGLDTFGAHHGTASRPSFGGWTRVTFAFHQASSTNDATSTTRTVGLTGGMSPTQSLSGTVSGNFVSSTLYFMSRGGASLFCAGRLAQVAVFSGLLSDASCGLLHAAGT